LPLTHRDIFAKLLAVAFSCGGFSVFTGVDEMREAGERFYTPNELADGGIMSLVKQWQERKAGRLQCYRLGRKILYGQKHIDAYFVLCESDNKDNENLRDVA
jgi:hypothetical protein